MGGASTKVSFLPEILALNEKYCPIILIMVFKAKKQETKEAFDQWNTDGDNKFLTFKEFDAGMKSLGITQERFIVSLCPHCPTSGHMGHGKCWKTYISKAFIGLYSKWRIQRKMMTNSVKKNSTKSLRRFTISHNDQTSFSQILSINFTLNKATNNDHAVL